MHTCVRAPAHLWSSVSSQIVKFAATAQDALNFRHVLLRTLVAPSFKACISGKAGSQFPPLRRGYMLKDQRDLAPAIPPVGLPGTADQLIPYLYDLPAYDVLHFPESQWTHFSTELFWRSPSKWSRASVGYFVEYAHAEFEDPDTPGLMHWSRKSRCLLKAMDGTVSFDFGFLIGSDFDFAV